MPLLAVSPIGRWWALRRSALPYWGGEECTVRWYAARTCHLPTRIQPRRCDIGECATAGSRISGRSHSAHRAIGEQISAKARGYPRPKRHLPRVVQGRTVGRGDGFAFGCRISWTSNTAYGPLGIKEDSAIACRQVSLKGHLAQAI